MDYNAIFDTGYKRLQKLHFRFWVAFQCNPCKNNATFSYYEKTQKNLINQQDNHPRTDVLALHQWSGQSRLQFPPMPCPNTV